MSFGRSTREKRFECSECMCVALESRLHALLVELLERAVDYRDIFWAPVPRARPNKYVLAYEFVPRLHRISARADLSFVGRDDYGHVPVDVELHEPLHQPLHDTCRFGHNHYILLSLLKMAQLHNSDEFPAEQMLRDSGKFDFSAPQFFHLFVPFGQLNVC